MAGSRSRLTEASSSLSSFPSSRAGIAKLSYCLVDPSGRQVLPLIASAILSTAVASPRLSNFIALGSIRIEHPAMQRLHKMAGAPRARSSPNAGDITSSMGSFIPPAPATTPDKRCSRRIPVLTLAISMSAASSTRACFSLKRGNICNS